LASTADPNPFLEHINSHRKPRTEFFATENRSDAMFVREFPLAN